MARGFSTMPHMNPDDEPSRFVERGKLIFGILAFIAFFNWFVFFGVMMYLGGDAVGVLPSHDGFIVKSHGNRTAVSEGVWVFSLYYSTFSLLAFPAVMIPFGIYEVIKRGAQLKWKWLIVLFLLVWTVGWFGSIGSAFHNSYIDWQKVKHGTLSLLQTPNTRTNVNQ